MTTTGQPGIEERAVAFLALIVAILAISAGHLFVIDDFTTFYLGVPLWLWIHLGVLVLLLVLAWTASERVLHQEGL